MKIRRAASLALLFLGLLTTGFRHSQRAECLSHRGRDENA